VRVGLVYDTHGLVRTEVLEALRGVDHILHAGDIGGAEVIEALSAIAPVSAIRGNNDTDEWGRELPDTELVELGGAWIYLVHDLGDLDIDPAAAGVDVVMSGHSHQPALFEEEGVTYVNPGSIGPRRFTLPISLGYLMIGNGTVRAELRALGGPK
jgi:putative phosphoesterase